MKGWGSHRMSTSKSTQRMSAELERAVTDLVAERGGLQFGEIVTHFDLVAETRLITDGRECIQRRHWATEGASPHLSYGVLAAQAEKIRRQLT